MSKTRTDMKNDSGEVRDFALSDVSDWQNGKPCALGAFMGRPFDWRRDVDMEIAPLVLRRPVVPGEPFWFGELRRHLGIAAA